MTLRSLAVLAVLPLAACGGTEGPDLGLDPRTERLDQQQCEQLRAAVDRVADDAFAGLPDGARRLAARLLKAAARPGQLLHATADPAFREAADHAA